jgi:hypothetical protein
VDLKIIEKILLSTKNEKRRKDGGLSIETTHIVSLEEKSDDSESPAGIP